MRETLEREMSATPAEFAHGLRLAFGAAAEGGPLKFRVQWGDAVLDIELHPLGERRIANLSLPRLLARLRFSAGDAAACERLLTRMDLAMHRGGG